MSALSKTEQDEVRAILRAAEVPERHIEWMVASCPSVKRARDFYPRTAVRR